MLSIAFAMLVGTALSAQDLSGNWQGTLKVIRRSSGRSSRSQGEGGGGRRCCIARPDHRSDCRRFDEAGRLHFQIVRRARWRSLRREAQRGRRIHHGNLGRQRTRFPGDEGQTSPLRLDRGRKRPRGSRTRPSIGSQFIEVEKNVKLEVLDWGGLRKTLGASCRRRQYGAHARSIATKLTAWYHVYGITRRGFGASDAPAPTRENYSSDRLGDDVLAVIDALKLNRPVLAGHSLAGEELSSVGSRHPEKVAGLIYLEAAYHWAYYDHEHGDLIVDRNEVQRMLEQLQPGRQPQLPGALVRDLLEMLPALQRDLQAEQAQLLGTPAAEAQPKPEPLTIGFAFQTGMQKYTTIPCPILAIYASPRDRGITDPAKIADADAKDLEPIIAFEKGVPSARVVRLAHAKHFIYESNEADVLREMNSFIATLP